MSKKQGNAQGLTARERLKAYYGLDGNGSSSKLELDAKDFNAKEYLGHLYRQSSLPQLVQTDIRLINDIKRLDSDRKNLVYENYSRFICASESVSEMRTKVQEVTSELKSAVNTIDTLAQSSETISAGLRKNKAKLDMLYHKSSLLKKLQFVLDLPRRLAHQVAAGRYSDAVRQYAYTATLLERYRHLSIFINIEQECHSIMQDAERSLWARAKDKDQPIHETIKSLSLLLLLQGESADEVYRLLDDTCFSKLRCFLDQQAHAFRNRDLLTFDTANHFKRLLSTFLPSFEELVAGIGEIFKANQKQTLGIEARFYKKAESLFEGEYIPLILKYAEVFWQDLTAASLGAATSNLALWLKELSTYDKLSGQDVVVNFLQRARLCTCDWEQHLVDMAFDDALEGFREKLNQSWPALYPTEDPFSLQNALLAAKNWLLDTILNKMKPKLELLLSSDIGFWQISGTWGFIFRYLQTSFRRFWETLFDKLDGESLLSSRFLLDLQSNVLQAIYDAYVGGLIHSFDIPYSHQPSQAEVAGEWMSDCAYLRDKALNFCQEALRRHALALGNRLSKSLTRHLSTCDWDSSSEPTAVSEPFKVLIRDIRRLEANIAALFPPKHDSELHTDTSSINSELLAPGRRSFQALRLSPHQASPIRSSFSTTGPLNATFGRHFSVPHTNEVAHKQWLARIDRLFSDQVEIFGTVARSFEGILTSILKVALKACVETIRLSAFGTIGFQQLQVDFEAVSLHIPSSIAADFAITTLIEEAILSGAKRCRQPKYLEPEVNLHQLPYH
ncbi:hypothetical protein L0F63_002565 [Massospora cicadina]|nr:hypothetical protein L0F63_002565 [Massospora cicadina]